MRVLSRRIPPAGVVSLAAALLVFGCAGPPKGLPNDLTAQKIRLVGEALEARDKGDLMGARQAIAQLSRLAPHDPTVERLRSEIEAQIERMREATRRIAAEQAAVAPPKPVARPAAATGSDGSIPVVIPGAAPVLAEKAVPASKPQAVRKDVTFFSTRAYVGRDEREVQVKFAVEGTKPRLVLIRGLGPALKGPTLRKGFLRNPLIELVARGDVVLGRNSNWRDSGDPAFIATTVAAGGGVPFNGTTQDAAIVTTLDPGEYTVRFRGVHKETGVGVVEIYELRP